MENKNYVTIKIDAKIAVINYRCNIIGTHSMYKGGEIVLLK